MPIHVPASSPSPRGLDWSEFHGVGSLWRPLEPRRNFIEPYCFRQQMPRPKLRHPRYAHDLGGEGGFADDLTVCPQAFGPERAAAHRWDWGGTGWARVASSALPAHAAMSFVVTAVLPTIQKATTKGRCHPQGSQAVVRRTEPHTYACDMAGRRQQHTDDGWSLAYIHSSIVFFRQSPCAKRGPVSRSTRRKKGKGKGDSRRTESARTSAERVSHTTEPKKSRNRNTNAQQDQKRANEKLTHNRTQNTKHSHTT